MRAFVAGLAVCVTGLGLVLPGQAPGNQALGAVTGSDPQAARAVAPHQGITDSVMTKIGGRNVRVEVGLTRDFIMLRDPTPPGGDLSATVRLTTTDKRNLPPISSVRLLAVKNSAGLSRWSPVLFPAYTADIALVYDPKSLLFFAGGGPSWAINSVVTATVEIKSAGKTTRVTFPTRVRAAF